MKYKFNRLQPTGVLEIVAASSIKSYHVINLTELSPVGDSFARQVSTSFSTLSTRIIDEALNVNGFDVTANVNIGGSLTSTTVDGVTTIDAIGAVDQATSTFDSITNILTLVLSNNTNLALDLSIIGAQGVTGMAFDTGTNLLTLTREGDIDLTVDLSDLQDVLTGLVPDTRLVSTGTGLTGGGDLSADRTISITAGGVSATELATNSVTTIKILDANVTNTKLAATGLDISKFTVGTLNTTTLPLVVMREDITSVVQNGVKIIFGTTAGEIVEIEGGGGVNSPRIKAGSGATLKFQNASSQNIITVSPTAASLLYSGTVALSTLPSGYVEATVGFNTPSISFNSGTTRLATKVIEIGDWDMDTDIFILVAHGLTDYTKVRSIDAVIRADDDLVYYKVPSTITSGAGDVDVTMGGLNATILTLNRLTGGFFDSVDFNSTVFNRGWVTITYEV